MTRERESQSGHSGTKRTRSCGQCSLCCKVMRIDEDEGVPGRASINKPDGMWCRFARHSHPSGGCSIYESRPRTCSGFICGYLAYEELPDYWKPDSCKMIIDISGSESDPIAIWQDIDCNERWRTEPFITDLFSIAAQYLQQHGKILSVYPPRFSVGKPYHVLCPISRTIMDLEGQDRVLGLAGMPYNSIHVDLLEEMNAKDMAFIDEPARNLPEYHTMKQYEEAQAQMLTRLRLRGYKINASRRRITR